MGELNKIAVRLVLLVCLGLLVYTIVTTSVYQVTPEELGLASDLPLAYYVGLGFLGCLWFVGFRSKTYAAAALALTFAYLYVAPSVIRVPVWVSNSYYPFGESLLIVEHGHLVSNPAASMVSYHFWPLFLYFSSAFTMITGLPHEVILKFFPLLIVALYAVLSVLILKIKVSFQYACLGAALVLAGFFIRQQYFGPQAIAFVFFLAIVLVVSMMFFKQRKDSRKLLVLLFGLLAVVTFFHPLTSFMTMAVLFALYISDRLTVKRTPAGFGRLLALAAVVWVAYNSYAAAPFFNTAIKHFTQVLTGTRNLTLYAESTREIQSTAMQVNFFASWGIVLITILLAGISIITILYKYRSKRQELAYPLFNIAMLVLFGVFAFAGEYGAVEAYQRAFMFGLVTISYLVITLLAKRPKIFIAILMVVVFLNIPAQYGADTYRLTTDSQLSGNAFIADYTPSDITLVGKFTLYIRYFDPMKSYQVLDVGLTSPFSNVPNATTLSESCRSADYIILSETEHNLFVFYIGRDPLQEVCNASSEGQGGVSACRIYDNGQFTLLKPTDPTVNFSGV